MGPGDGQFAEGAPLGPSRWAANQWLLQRTMERARKLGHSLEPWLTYTTTNSLVVDVWQMGTLHSLLWSFLAFFTVYLTFFVGNTWAYTEVPVGAVNAYHGLSDEYLGARAADYGYCTTAWAHNASWSSKPQFDYDTPQCIRRDDRFVVQKGRSGLHITTLYQEQHVLAWPCASDPAITQGAAAAPAISGKRDECAAGNGGELFVLQTATGQCSCNYTRTLYPLAVESLTIAFEHAFNTSTSLPPTVTSHVLLAGSSQREPASDDEELLTYFRYRLSMRFEPTPV